MEHPVPQNVTSFEFHLVGDMTLKQFGYLAAGFIIAYISFTLLLPVNVLLALPIIAVSTLTGIAFAFIPIFDRPLDHWVLAFLKAVYSPTQGAWRLSGQKNKTPENDPIFSNRLQRYLASLGVVDLPPQTTTTSSLPKMTRLIPTSQATPNQPAPNPVPQQTTPQVSPAANLPESEELVKLVAMANEARLLQTKIAEAEKQIHLLQATAAEHKITGPEYTQKIQQASENLQNLVAQTGRLYEQTAEASRPAPAAPIVVAPVVVPQKPQVVVVEPQKEVKTQLTLTSLPNVINGVILDADESYLEGVIVIIHNSEGLPVRALKTNKLGQFSGATPLPSGIYTLTMEKDGLEFDALQITLGGEVIQPLNIHPKKENHDK